mmetsp:Transcript_1654/g.7353  ORF Transcript_1654/g.7353 Transcript_1654/m.7353 type:complete len:322 (-) Transcript_1654:98-1063(-)
MTRAFAAETRRSASVSARRASASCEARSADSAAASRTSASNRSARRRCPSAAIMASRSSPRSSPDSTAAAATRHLSAAAAAAAASASPAFLSSSAFAAISAAVAAATFPLHAFAVASSKSCAHSPFASCSLRAMSSSLSLRFSTKRRSVSASAALHHTCSNSSRCDCEILSEPCADASVGPRRPHRASQSPNDSCAPKFTSSSYDISASIMSTVRGDCNPRSRISEGAGAMLRARPADGGAITTGEPKDDLERFERTLGLPPPALPTVGPLKRESFRLMAASGLRTSLGLPNGAFFFAAAGVFLRLALWGAGAAAGGGAGA